MQEQPIQFDDATSLYLRDPHVNEWSTVADESGGQTAVQAFEIGSLINGRYFLQRILGSGGMGIVYLGHDRRLDRQVAIKVIPTVAPAKSATLERILEHEAKTTAGLNHPNIAIVLDYGFHHRRAFSVYEFVEGENLRQVLNRRKTLPLEEVSRIVDVLARALDFAHSKGIVHRDLKPENICLTFNGDFKILDLGIAQRIRDFTDGEGYFGTPAYSSPEQAAGRPVDGKSDQYSLGVLAYELLTGTRLFTGKSPVEILDKHQVDPPSKPSDRLATLPREVDEAILKALEKSPSQRFSSCREFSNTLGRQSSNSSQLPHLLPINPHDRLAFFLSHATEDSLSARGLVNRLEIAGFPCWLAQRDALPNDPYQRQMLRALKRSAIVVVLLSRQAIKSLTLYVEVEAAYKFGCQIVPVFVDSTSSEIESLSHTWQVFFQSNQLLEWNRTRDLDHVVEQLVRSAVEIGLKPQSGSTPAQTASKPRIDNYVWATDANQLEIGDLQHIVFRNEVVDDFLRMQNKNFLAATKGLGKTLLLTFKRQLLAEASRGKTVTMIPEGRPFLDLMDELKQLSKHYHLPLADLSFTKRIWSAAFRVSAVSYHSSVIHAEVEQDELKKFPANIERWLLGGKIEPTVVFRELIGLSLSELNRLLNDTENFLAKKMRSIHSGTYFFVDKVDQAVRGLPPDAWIYVQAGLIEAAWDLMGSNRHLRVFATIRQEAFTNYRSDIKNNLFGATTTLQYSEEELSQMMDQLSSCYEGCQNFNQFVGFNVIRHSRRPSPEDCFQFVRRHTFGRPRDLVMIASEISARRATLDETRLSEIVHQISGTALINNIFAESSVMLDCLNDEEQRERFVEHLTSNILSHAEVVGICEAFNGLPAGSIQPMGENCSEIFHPFRDLYLAGLLGVVEPDPETEKQQQRFRQPNDFLSIRSVELPVSEFYLLHPALNRYITSLRQRRGYRFFQHIVVGQGLPWLGSYRLVMDLERVVQQLGATSFRELVHRILNQIQTITEKSELRLLRFEIETSADWKSLSEFAGQSGHDEVLFALDDLLKYFESSILFD